MEFSIPEPLIKEIESNMTTKVGNKTRVSTDTTENVLPEILANWVRPEK